MANEIKQTVVIEAELSKIQRDLKQLEGSYIQNIASSTLGAIRAGDSL